MCFKEIILAQCKTLQPIAVLAVWTLQNQMFCNVLLSTFLTVLLLKKYPSTVEMCMHRLQFLFYEGLNETFLSAKLVFLLTQG